MYKISDVKQATQALMLLEVEQRDLLYSMQEMTINNKRILDEYRVTPENKKTATRYVNFVNEKINPLLSKYVSVVNKSLMGSLDIVTIYCDFLEMLNKDKSNNTRLVTICQLIVCGKTQNEIADMMNVAKITVARDSTKINEMFEDFQKNYKTSQNKDNDNQKYKIGIQGDVLYCERIN